MVNLLPTAVQKSQVRRYYLRFASFLFIVLAGTFALGAGLFAPSYFLAKNEAETSLRYLETLRQSADVREREGASAELSRLVERTSILKAYDVEPAVGPILEEIGALTPKGVAVTYIAIKRDDATAGTIAVEGRAETRTALLAFADALKGSALLTEVAVPVEQLAIDADLEFSLSFPFELSP